MNIKNELIVSLVGLIVVVGLLAYYTLQYKQNNPSFIPSTNSVNKTNNSLLTAADVAKHNNSSDCWLIVNNAVYNVTDFIPQHPGGAERITPFCGTDATQAYAAKDGQGAHSSRADETLVNLKIGDLKP